MDRSAKDAGETRRPSFWDAFRDPRLALMLGFGFASGLPNPLTGSTLTAWLGSLEVDLTTIGLFAAVHLPYNFKFVWAPLLDRFRLPFLGRRRGWMLLTQLVLVVGVGALGSLDPRSAPFAVALLAFGAAFASASQDIVIDAYRTELLPAAERASGTALFVAAYRVALIAAGAGALILSDRVSWTVVYWLLAALMGVGVVTTLLAPAPPAARPGPRSLREAVVEPFREFLKRPQAPALLAILMLYKAGDVVAGHLLIPFLQELGFSNTEVGAVLKGLGLGATVLGSLLGGGLVAKWGLKRSLLVFGVLQAVANVAYAVLATVGESHALMTVAIALDNLMNGMGTAAFVALLMTLCDVRYTATQYALFSSLMTVPGRLFGMGSGWLAAQAGWPAFFLLTIVAAAPALALLLRVDLEREPAP